MIIQFGKHKGQDTNWVFNNDPRYVDWMLNTESENSQFNAVKATFAKMRFSRAQHDRYEKAAQGRQQHYQSWDYGETFHSRDDFEEMLKKMFGQQSRRGNYDEWTSNSRKQQQYRPPPRQPQAVAWWEVLQVTAQADTTTIKRAYRKLASINHPDKGGDTKKMQSINAAYDAAMKGR